MNSWRDRASRVRVWLGPAALAALLALSAQVTVRLPGAPVPQTLQTLVVVLAGAVLGPQLGVLAVLLYLVAGALSLPVFADGASGWSHLVSSSAGYFLGFVVAAWIVGNGVRSRGSRPRFVHTFTVMMSAHGVLLLLGWAWLATFLGLKNAFLVGVQPFLAGAAIKSGVGSVLFLLRPGFLRER